MPREIDPRPASVQHGASANKPGKAGGKNLRVQHTAVGNWPKGHVIAPDELADGTDVNRLIALGAVVETDDPATGALDTSTLPPGAAVTHQLSPGDELPPNALEVAKEGQQSEQGATDNLDDMTVEQLHEEATRLNIEGRGSMNKAELQKAVRKAQK
jgi:hypothetical protein